MKKIIFLSIFFGFSLMILAEESTSLKQYLIPKTKISFEDKLKPKTFIADNCELKTIWHAHGFNFQLIYVGAFPPKLAEYLKNDNSAKVFSAFYVIFLDDNGFELVKDMCYFNDFILEGEGDKQKAVFRDHLKCDPAIYDRIASIVVDFSQ